MKFVNKGRKIDTEVHRRFGQVLEQGGYSTYTAADMLGISRPAVQTYVDGSRKITIDMAAKICKTFDIDYVWFITGLKL